MNRYDANSEMAFIACCSLGQHRLIMRLRLLALGLLLCIAGAADLRQAKRTLLDRYLSLPKSIKGFGASKLWTLRRRLGAKAWKKVLPLLALRPSKAVREKLQLLAEHIILPSWQLEPFNQHGSSDTHGPIPIQLK